MEDLSTMEAIRARMDGLQLREVRLKSMSYYCY